MYAYEPLQGHNREVLQIELQINDKDSAQPNKTPNEYLAGPYRR